MQSKQQRQYPRMCIGFELNERSRLPIRAFYFHLSASTLPEPLPDSLTLCYLPRINCSPLDVGESSVRPDSPAFVTLHRIVSARKVARGAIYGSRERVRASEGVRFEVYLRGDKLVKGILRRDDSGNWKIEGRCALESGGSGVEEVGVCAAVEGEGEVVSERVEMTVQRRRRHYRGLEEIPEERGEAEGEEGECCCDCGGGGGRGETERESDGEMEMEMEGVRWAVDLGIWVMCLGVGYLVSRASSKSIRRGRFL